MASVSPQVQLAKVPPFMFAVSAAAFHENIRVCQALTRPLLSHAQLQLVSDSRGGFPFPSMEHLKASAAFNYFFFSFLSLGKERERGRTKAF